MKNTIIAFLTVTALGYCAQAAEPKETVADAIKALKEKANYSWSTKSEMANSQFPAMVTKGKAEKDGFTLISSEGPNGEMQALKKGDKGVVKTEEGWKTAEELWQGGQGGQGMGRIFSGRLLNAPAPVDDAGELLKGCKEVKAGEGGLFSAELTEQAAKDNAGFFGRRRPGQGGFTPPEPKDAKGTVKFWVKDGALIKYELKTSAKITFQEQDRDIDRTTTTELSNIGSTKVEAAEEAKKKL
jgi:hypothetical protein